MKKLIVFAFTALIAVVTFAQPAGIHRPFPMSSGVLTSGGSFLSGGATVLPAGTTNQFVTGGTTNQVGSPTSSTTVASSNLVVSVWEFDNVGFTWSFSGNDHTTNGTITVRISKSYDNGVVFETSPSWSFPVTLPTASGGATSYVVRTNLDCRGATHLAFNFENNAAVGGDATNCNLSVNLKSPKFGFKQVLE